MVAAPNAAAKHSYFFFVRRWHHANRLFFAKMINEFCLYIWRKGATLEELLIGKPHPTLQSVVEELPPEILETWCENACGSNQHLFECMINTLQKKSRISNSTRQAEKTRWGRQLHWIIEALNSPHDVSHSHLKSDAIPFINIIDSIVISAKSRLFKKIERFQPEIIISDEAFETLQSDLRNKISNIAAPILFEAFLVSKKNKSENFEEDQYIKFSSQFRDKYLSYVVKKYPVLFRLISVLCDQWIITNAEFLRRFSKDRSLIDKKLFNKEHSNLKIIKLNSDLGDPHNYGRSVKILTLSCGKSILYKPRPLKIDEEWSRLIYFFNSSNPPTILKVPRSFNMGKYGWSEFIEYSACKNVSDFSTFYERIGAWLFLLHAFSATDIHEENIVAHGAQPVPIDLELTLQQHESLKKDLFGRILLDTAYVEAERFVSASVLATGLMPAYGRDINESIYRASGLGVANLEETTIEWRNVNTENMEPRIVQINKIIRTNVPFIENQLGEYENHQKSISNGFISYANFFLKQKNNIEFQSLFANFSDCRVRTLMKPTRFYSHLLSKATDFRGFSDGIFWGLTLRFPDRFVSWGGASEISDAWVADNEYRSLINLSVPIFTTEASSTGLSSFGQNFDCYFDVAGFRSVMTSINEFNKNDIIQQNNLIELVFKNEQAHFAKNPHSNNTVESKSKETSHSDTINLENIATNIFLHLERLAIKKKGSAAWIGFDWLGDTSIPQLAPLGQDLYSGSGGIAIFLAAYGVTFNKLNSIQLSYDAISPMRQLIKSDFVDMYARKIGTGLGTGVGSIIYTLTCLSELLNDPKLLTEAVQFSKVIDLRLLELDSTHDLIGGGAGCLVSLLKCYSLSNNEVVLQKAIIVADFLFEKSTVWGEFGRLWINQSMGPSPLTGMSHGTSGFAYVFSYLHSITGNAKYLEIYENCIRYELSCFNLQHENWPDLREVAIQSDITWPSQWCHGSTGIGLCRLAMLDICKQDDPRLIIDLELAINATKKAWPYLIDTACCGSAGNLWFLFEAGEFLGNSDLVNLSINRFTEMSKNAGSKLNFRWTSVGSEEFNLGFFRGVSGIGYAAIRLLGAKVPNILIAG